MKHSINAILITLAFVIGFTVLTAITVVLTEEKRIANKAQYKEAQLMDLIGSSQEIQYHIIDSDYPYQVIKVNQAHILEAQTDKGYGGEIRLLILLNQQSKIEGIHILKPHLETPGLGDVIEADKSDWLEQFYQLSLEDLPKEQWAIKKDGGVFDAASGATITSRAVTNAIKQALENWQKVEGHE